MSKFNRFTTVLFCITACNIFVTPCMSQSVPETQKSSIEKEFKVHYDAWTQWRKDNMAQSILTDNEPFIAIIKLGPTALPLIIDKIKQNRSDFHLQRAVRKISKRKFARNEWPVDRRGDSVSAAAMYINWWDKDVANAPATFQILLAEKQAYQNDGKMIEAKQVTTRIENLGIAILPSLFVAIENGDSSLVPLASKLTDGSISDLADPQTCAKWWKENQQNWLLPPH